MKDSVFALGVFISGLSLGLQINDNSRPWFFLFLAGTAISGLSIIWEIEPK